MGQNGQDFAPPAGSPSAPDPLGELKAENETLRIAASTVGYRRLVTELHRVAAGEAGPAGTALLERSSGGGSWTVRAFAGRELSTAVLRTLPDPLKPPRRTEPLPSPTPTLRGAWAVPLSGGGRTGLWIAPPPPTGGDEGRGRRLWELVGDAVWDRYVTGEALSVARDAIALRDAQVALYKAASESETPQTVLTQLLTTLAAACGADRAVLHTVGPDARRIAAAGVELSRPVAAVAAEQDAKLAYAVAETSILAPSPNGVVPFDREALAKIGVKSLFGRAAGTSLGGGGNAAVLLISKSDSGAFPSHAVRTLSWAGGFFASVLPRCSRAAVASRLARRDGLTGLANRRTFDEQLAGLSAAAVAARGDLAVLMFDLDHFKSVNDTHGHAAGDRVLREAAAAIQQVVSGCRSNDSAVAARYGGEELVVLLPNFGPAGAERVAEEIRAAVSRIELPPGGPRTHVTTSVGLAVLPFDADDAASLMSAADAALYAAKSGGRNRVVRARTRGAAEGTTAPR
ncbi:hypothetical protein LzC2_30280 [Planctomycetes bacterium LzC2]|uniref:diguanylate cyclase n=1 Tax=Alienimonas chondri TaxID=2681879 RepID=A0ABX1VGH2_9PLAN|nr:hypothetical protein [Alienimonas chondri]